MKIALFISILTLLLVPSCIESAETKVIFFGDSMTAQGTWVDHIHSLPGFQAVNASVAGRTTAQGAQALEAVLQAHPDADKLVIMLGLHDWVGIDSDPDWGDLVRNMRAICEVALEHFPARNIILVAPPDIDADNLSAERSAEGYDVDVSAYIRYLPNRYGWLARSYYRVSFYDYSRALNPEHLTDGVFPNAEGHNRLNQLFSQMLIQHDWDHYIFFGDSITHGGVISPNWVAQVSAESRVVAFNEGSPGRQAHQSSTHFGDRFVRHTTANAAFILLGVNDMPDRDDRSDAQRVDDAVAGVAACIDLAIERGIDRSKIILAAPCNISVDDMSDLNTSKGYHLITPLLLQLQERYQELATQREVQYLSLYGVVSGENLTDGLHPNAAGHTEIAAAINAFMSGDQSRVIEMELLPGFLWNIDPDGTELLSDSTIRFSGLPSTATHHLTPVDSRNN